MAEDSHVNDNVASVAGVRLQFDTLDLFEQGIGRNEDAATDFDMAVAYLDLRDGEVEDAFAVRNARHGPVLPPTRLVVSAPRPAVTRSQSARAIRWPSPPQQAARQPVAAVAGDVAAASPPSPTRGRLLNFAREVEDQMMFNDMLSFQATLDSTTAATNGNDHPNNNGGERAEEGSRRKYENYRRRMRNRHCALRRNPLANMDSRRLWLKSHRFPKLLITTQRELCAVCYEYDTSYSRYRRLMSRSGGVPKICRECYEETMTSHTTANPNGPFRLAYQCWKSWLDMEQDEYKKGLGCTQWNTHYEDIYVRPTKFPYPELFMLKRVKACIGWAVHGLVLEFIDGVTRSGFVSDVSSIYDDEGIKRRRSTEWIDIAEGDYIVAIYGYNLARTCFLCHTLTLKMASGQIIEFASQHEPWKGEPFSFSVPETALVHHISFRDGKCAGITAAESVSHLPIKSSQRVENYLGEKYQETFDVIQLCMQRVDKDREKKGDKPLGRDLWSKILFEYLKCSDLLDAKSSTPCLLKEMQQMEAKEKEENDKNEKQWQQQDDRKPAAV